MATVIDSLYAIEKQCLLNQELTLAELVEMLKHNFEGHEEWRMKLRTKYPKFGNDVAEVDKYARLSPISLQMRWIKIMEQDTCIRCGQPIRQTALLQRWENRWVRHRMVESRKSR